MRVAVIGGGVGGLAAAGLLQARGAEVALFERASVLGGKAGQLVKGGLRFDTGPTLLALPHFVSEVFAALAAPMPPLYRLPLQCRYEDHEGHRFEAFEDLDATCASAESLQPGEGARLRAFYAEAERIYLAAGVPYLDAPYDGFARFIRRVLGSGVSAVRLGAGLPRLDALARASVRTAFLQRFIGRFATYVGASPYRASASYAMIAHIERRFGIFHPAGGMGALVQALSAAVVAVGVQVHKGVAVQWRQHGRGFVVSRDGAGSFFDKLVLNTDPSPPGQALSLSAHVLMLRVPRRLALPHHTILFSRSGEAEFDALFSGRLPWDATLYLCHPAATDALFARPHETALYVMANAPPWPLTMEFPSALSAQAMLARVRPLIGDGAELVAERTPHDFARLGAPDGALYGAVGHGRLGPFRRPRLRGPVAGQFHVGGGTHPGGGVPMVARSGRFVADLVWAER